MKSNLLIEVEPSGPSASMKLTLFCKANDILTHRTKGMRREDHPWIAIRVFQQDKGKSIGNIMAESCRLYEESGYLATGEGRLSAVRSLCKQLNIVMQ